MELLREGVLAGRTVALVGAGADAATLESVLQRLGAGVRALRRPPVEDEAAAAWSDVDALVYDGRPAFGRGGGGGLGAVLEQLWSAVRAAVAAGLLARGQGGKVVFIAPGPEAGALAPAAGASLENLARTLGVEWARYRVTVTALVPGAATTREQLNELVGFVLSPAGDYFSGCRLELDRCPPPDRGR